jgi:hypothetical protein
VDRNLKLDRVRRRAVQNATRQRIAFNNAASQIDEAIRTRCMYQA